MSRIKNKPKYNNFILKAVRRTIEHRASWLYLLLKQIDVKGIKWEDIGYTAIGMCGCIQGNELSSNGKRVSFKYLRKKLFNYPAQLVFQMKVIKNTDDNLFIDFGYCPLVTAWRDLGCNSEEIKRLCDISMEGDRGIAKSFGGKLELGETIANGHSRCQIKFVRNSIR